MRELYPVFMKLSGRRVLIAGGGKLARQKLATLESTGADVVMVAPRIDRRELGWQGQQWVGSKNQSAGRLTLLTRGYGPDLLEGCVLVFAATDDPAVNHAIVAGAAERGILANAVDDPDFCQFYTPAVTRRAGVTVALSTSGGFPGLSGALREILELWLPDGDGAMLEDLFALRGALRRGLDPERRRRAMAELIEGVKREYLEPLQGGHGHDFNGKAGKGRRAFGDGTAENKTGENKAYGLAGVGPSQQKKQPSGEAITS